MCMVDSIFAWSFASSYGGSSSIAVAADVTAVAAVVAASDAAAIAAPAAVAALRRFVRFWNAAFANVTSAWKLSRLPGIPLTSREPSGRRSMLMASRFRISKYCSQSTNTCRRMFV